MKWSLYLGRIFGIKLFVHWTFSLLIAWIVFLNIKQGLGTSDIFWSIGFVLSVFACLTMHELGHALTARRFGVRTQDIILLPIGGMARLESIPEVPRQELLVAIAGPIVNVVIAGILYLFLFFTSGIPQVNQFATINAHNFLFMLFSVNIVLAVFNLIPAFPMDGGRMLRALLSMKLNRSNATRIAAFIGQVLAIGFAIIGLFSNPFLVVIGIVIFLGAQSEANFTEAKYFLKGYTVNDILMHEFATISIDDPISKAIKVILNGQSKDFIVMHNNVVSGTLSRDEIIKALYEKDQHVKVKDVMNKSLKYLKPTDSLESLFQQMQLKQLTIMPVIENDKLVGVVDSENLIEFIMITQAKKNEIVVKESEELSS